ncbi:hypothetical protein EV183_000682 [Coemansia sp. RSA 2336]|nr:hypothetical protein EV183_000682 [Coemansia sp. RSA 2336]
MVQDLSMRMAQWAFTPGLMRDFWSRFTFITTSLVGASIEPALLRMPRLSHFFFSTDELIDGEGPRGANFTNYNVGRQLAPPFMPTDASFEVDVVLGISQLPANIGTHELLMYRQQSDDYVEILSAEYIDRLITTDLAEYLILNATEGLPRLADNGLLDRAPHDTSWRFVRNRYMFFFADIRFEGHDVVPSSYSLAIFDRENDQLVTDIDSEEYEDSNHGTASSSNGTVITGSSADFLDESSFDESPYDDSASDDTAVDM